MSWTDWKNLFEGMACSVGQEAGVVGSVAEAAPPAECAGGRVRVRAFLQGRTLASTLVRVGRRS